MIIHSIGYTMKKEPYESINNQPSN